jgi:hypothetical protein
MQKVHVKLVHNPHKEGSARKREHIRSQGRAQEENSPTCLAQGPIEEQKREEGISKTKKEKTQHRMITYSV